MSSSNIVEFKGPQKAKTSKTTEKGPAAPVIDMTERRQEIITEERRKKRRTILGSFIGAFCVVPRKGLVKVNLYDISEAGLSFDVDNGQFPVGEELAIRLYLSQETYFPFTIRVQNVRDLEGENACRHGSVFLKNGASDLALQHFVKFIESVSPFLLQDRGDHLAKKTGR